MINQEKLESLYNSVLESSMKARIERVKSKYTITTKFEKSQYKDGGLFWAEIEEFPKLYDCGKTKKESIERVAKKTYSIKNRH